MKWHFEKFKGNMAVFAICPNCRFYKNISYMTANAEVRIDPSNIYHYCPNCGEKNESDYNSENIDVVWNRRNFEELCGEN